MEGLKKININKQTSLQILRQQNLHHWHLDISPFSPAQRHRDARIAPGTSIRGRVTFFGPTMAGDLSDQIADLWWFHLGPTNSVQIGFDFRQILHRATLSLRRRALSAAGPRYSSDNAPLASASRGVGCSKSPMAMDQDGSSYPWNSISMHQSKLSTPIIGWIIRKIDINRLSLWYTFTKNYGKSPFLMGRPSINGPSIPWLC